MPWPTPQDFQQAMQAPAVAFRDPELKTARPDEDRLGLPRAISGAFACVFKLTTAAGKVWAVRCFTREVSDHQKRYEAISRTLVALNLPYTVGFEYQPDGILVNGKRYPILKMEWVRGEGLIPYVRTRLGTPALRGLATKFLDMARRLTKEGVAHGDLQHGNVVIAGDNPVLIDYDGMFVPPMAGWVSSELGHKNFQHPARKNTDFGVGLDHFSVWVLHLSLSALAADKTLWDRHNGGDECLLLREKDFKEPNASAVLRDIQALRDPAVSGLLPGFRAALAAPPLQVPLVGATGGTNGTGGLPDWMKNMPPAAARSSVTIRPPVASGPEAGDRREITLPGGVTMAFAYCPPGAFPMGSPDWEKERGKGETTHLVTLTRGFLLGVYPVTQAQWQAVMGTSPSYFKGDHLPVERVSWDDAVQFCRRVKEKVGRTVRLPTEAEWEYAARGGTTTPFYWGHDLNGTQANCDGNNPYGTTTRGAYLEGTSEVGRYSTRFPHPWGLCDMHGNVWEWCEDWFDLFYYKGSPPVDPVCLHGKQEQRVLRGGAWFYSPRSCRAACRFSEPPRSYANTVGFRIVLAEG